MNKNSAFAIAFLGFGCYHISTDASLMDPGLHLARTCTNAVKLYSSSDRVPAAYREIALLTSTGRTRETSEGDMIKSMREKAARIGANGIILNGIDEPKAATKVAAEATNVLTGYSTDLSPERKGRALAIYVAADSAAAREVCAAQPK